MDYHDLDITIRREGDGYMRVAVCGLPHGLPIAAKGEHAGASTLDLEALREAVARIANEPDGAGQIPVVGQLLYQGLFGNWLTSRQLNRCIGAVLDHEDAGVRVRLKLSIEDDPELARLPWEFLYYPEEERFLAVLERTPLVRYLDGLAGNASQEAPLPLRILVVTPDRAVATGLRPDLEKEIICNAVKELKSGRVDLRFLDGPVTRERFLAVLRGREPGFGSEPFRVLHFIGHGNSHQGQAAIEIDSADGGSDHLEAKWFADFVRTSPGSRLKLVVSNTCEGAALTSASVEGEFISVASELVRAGLPAAVAMQYPIFDDEARTFAAAFYGSLFAESGGRVEAAISAAREELALNFPASRAWGAPVLYTRTTGPLFKPITGNWVRDHPRTRAQAVAEAESITAHRDAIRTLRSLPPESPERQELLASEQRELRRAQNRLRRRALVLAAVPAVVIALTAAGAAYPYEEYVPLRKRLELVTSWVGSVLPRGKPPQPILLVPITGNTQFVVSRRSPGVSPQFDASWRRQHARVLDALARARAKVVVFNMRFESSSPYDQDFAAAMRAADRMGTRVVIGFRERDRDEPLVAPAFRTAGAGTGALCVGTKGWLATRVAPLWIRFAGAGKRREMPSLGIAAAAAYRDLRPQGVNLRTGHVVLAGSDGEWRIRYADLETADRRAAEACPVLEGAQVAEGIINHSGLSSLLDPARRIPYESFLSPLPPDVAERVRGAIVVIGLAADTADLHPAYGREELHYGLEIQADAVQSILVGRWLRPVGLWGQFLVIASMASIGALIAYHSRSRSSRPRVRWLLGSTILFFVIAGTIQLTSGLLLNVFFGVTAMLLSFFTVRWLRRRLSL